MFYQVFNKDNTDSVNDQRFAAYITIKQIDELYKNINNFNTILNKPLFTPTTIMELENFHKHAFVIRNVYFNSHKRLVFMVSTKEIKLQNNTSKKLTQIPSGKFKHVRFDVDASSATTLRDIWSSTEKICSNNPNATLKSLGGSTSYPYCNKPLPPYPEICGDILVERYLKRDVSESCIVAMNEIVKGKTLPDALQYVLLTANYLGIAATCTYLR